MAQGNSFGHLLGGGAQPAPRQAAPAQQGPIASRPVFSVPNVDQQQDNARADRTEKRQQDNSTFRTMSEQEAVSMGLPAGGVYQINGLGEVKTVKAAPSANPADASEGERKAAAFLIRALGANKSYEGAGVGPRSLIGQAARDTFPDATNYFSSAERQVAESAQDEFIAASLRQDSGAAIPDAELERQRRIYFPMPGDGPEVIEAKRQARLRAIAGLEQSSGRLLEPTLAEFGQMGGAAQGGAPVTVEQSAAAWGDGPKYDEQGNPILPGYGGGVYDAEGNYLFLSGTVTDETPTQDPRDEMGFLESVGETLTGSERSTPEIEAMPDWTTMPAPGMAGFLASLGTFVSSAEETAQILQAQGLATRVRQDAKGNFILTGQDGKEYAIKPGFRMSDVPRAAGAVLAFTPAGRATSILGGAAGAGATQSLIEGTQVAAGGNFDTSDVVLAAAGGALPPAIGRAASGRRGGGGGSAPPVVPTTPGGQVIQAADNFNTATGANVQPIAADVGGPLTRRASGALAQTTFGAKPIVEGAQAVNDQARAGIRTLAGRQGAVPQSKQAGGEVAIKGADKTMQRAKLKVDALYTKARKAAGDATLDLPMAKATLQKHIDELSQVPGGGEGLSALQSLAQDIGTRRFPVDGIKAMRTQLRDKFLKDGLRGSDVERRVNEVVDAAELDIEDGLLALGKRDAAQLYAEASSAAAERFALIDDVLAPVLGRNGEKSGEQVFAAIDQLSRGDAVSLGKFMRALPEEDAGSIRGLIIDRLGRASKGRQDADGQAFSLNDFLTRWNDEGLSREAKSVLFDGETIAALDDLARVAQGTKEGQRFANFSNTGGVTWFNALLNGAPLGAAVGGVVPAAAAAGTSVTAQLGLGKLLGNPGFARWLAKMPKQPSASAVRKHIDGLEKIAKANPGLSADIIDLQSRLRAALPASGSQVPVGVQSGAVPLAAQPRDAGSNTTGSGTQ